MFDNIVFIGGIHGVGKSTICNKICQELKIEYLSASSVLKWQEINNDLNNKKIKDVNENQDRLIFGLTNLIKKDIYYLLDGHYCLLNNDNEIVNIPLNTFKSIKPISLNVIVGEIDEIKTNLENRDNKSYDYNLLEEMQEQELLYAKQLSQRFGLKLNVGSKNDYSEILLSLHQLNFI